MSLLFKYDYSKTVYQDMHSKVLIICPQHGEFYQRAQSHLSGSGCPMCKYDAHMERIKRLEQQIKQERGLNGVSCTKLLKILKLLDTVFNFHRRIVPLQKV